VGVLDYVFTDDSGNSRGFAMSEFILRGRIIGSDGNGFLCLTDMWRVAGEPEHRKPNDWLSQLATRDLASALIAKLNGNKKLVATRRGRHGGGTYAHVILALAYAEHLNPDFGVEVREIALRVYVGDVSVLDDYNRARASQLEEDGQRVMVRDEVRRNNSDLNAILKEVGATHSAQWAAFHNEGYKGLYNGETEDDIHRRKDLAHNQKILDHMGFDELITNAYRTSIAQRYLRKHHPISGVKRAMEVHYRMGKRVRDDLTELGLDMPEDMPAVDSINDARKRLKAEDRKRIR